MDKIEAKRVMDAFIAGYIEPGCQDLMQAGAVLRKTALVREYPSVANPEVKLQVRVVVNGIVDVPPVRGYVLPIGFRHFNNW